MANSNQSGFSLVEIMLVLAISSSLAGIALVGQQALRSQSEFDAAINKIVSVVNAAHTEAVAGVNISPAASAGTGVASCPGGPPGKETVFAGVSWSINNAGQTIDYYKSTVGANGVGINACIFDTRTVGMPAAVTVKSPVLGGQMLFVRNSVGALVVCSVPISGANPIPSYVSGVCGPLPISSGAIVFTLVDASGHNAGLSIDQSGLAKRTF